MCFPFVNKYTHNYQILFYFDYTKFIVSCTRGRSEATQYKYFS